MMPRFFLILSLIALAMPAPLAAQSVRDFQLPPSAAENATPEVQGPVDDDGIAPVAAPQDVESTAQGAAVSEPERAATVQPLPTSDEAPGPAAVQTGAPRRTLPRPQPSPLPTGAARVPLDPGATPPLVPSPATPVPGATPTTPIPDQSPVAEGQTDGAAPATGSPSWLLPAVGGGMLMVLLLAYLASRRRKSAEPALIERPVVGGLGGLAAPDALQVRAEAIKLTRSVMNATLQYRVTLLNRSSSALSKVVLGADVTSAHGGAPVEEQVASTSQPLEERHVFERIAPGQSVAYDGQITIPLAQAKIIRQGPAALFVPLLRVRLDGATEEPVAKTFVIGNGAQGGGRVTPFRFDEGPRSYAPIAARVLD